LNAVHSIQFCTQFRAPLQRRVECSTQVHCLVLQVCRRTLGFVLRCFVRRIRACSFHARPHFMRSVHGMSGPATARSTPVRPVRPRVLLWVGHAAYYRIRRGAAFRPRRQRARSAWLLLWCSPVRPGPLRVMQWCPCAVSSTLVSVAQHDHSFAWSRATASALSRACLNGSPGRIGRSLRGRNISLYASCSIANADGYFVISCMRS